MPAGSRGEASRERLFVSLKNLILTLLAIIGGCLLAVRYQMWRLERMA